MAGFIDLKEMAGSGAALVRSGVSLLDQLAAIPPAVAVGALRCATTAVLTVVGEKALADDADARFQEAIDHLLDNGLSDVVRDGSRALRHDLEKAAGVLLGRNAAKLAGLPLKVLENLAGLVQHARDGRSGVDVAVLRRAARLAAACTVACDLSLRDRLEWRHEPLTSCAVPRGIVAWDDQEVWVALRGSRSTHHYFQNDDQAAAFLADWGANFDCGLVAEAGTGGLVCRGFQSLADELWPRLLDKLQAHGGKEVTLAGHSQGGAVALLLGQRLRHAGFRVREVFQFGSPRVGNAGFVDAVRLPCWRFENQHDLVPWLPVHVPPLFVADQLARLFAWVFEVSGPAKFPSYRHAGALHFIGFNEQIFTTDNLYAKELLLESVRGTLLSRGGFVLAVRDHQITEYARILGQLAELPQGEVLAQGALRDQEARPARGVLRDPGLSYLTPPA